MKKAESWDPQPGITRVKTPIARLNPNAVKAENKMKVTNWGTPLNVLENICALLSRYY